ncbi:MAG: hypothetical protein D6719_05280 [Candidatus Dadabacteria bacterium]|nr:MAG: hypothetical protein D6719_05280 [Candidatus Dadabacteria bacterium]
MTLKKILIFAGILLCSLLTDSSTVRAELPATRKIIGGSFLDLTSSPVALILTNSFLCSGVLVGPRHVLTAAHCVTGPDVPPSEYTVLINGQAFSVTATYHNPRYNPLDSPFFSAPHDLGMLVLNRTPSGVTPAAVMHDLPVAAGDSAGVFGYGTNELSGLPLLSNGKGANLIISDADGGVLIASHSESGASTCHGDSGGPLFQAYGRFSALVGIVSAGTNWNVGDVCILGGSGVSIFSDLQSQSSKNFLSSFKGLYRMSGPLMLFQATVTDIKKSVRATLLLRSQSENLSSSAASFMRILKALKRLVSGIRFKLIKRSIRSAKKLKRTSSKKAARKLIRMLKKIERLGVPVEIQ